MKTRKRAPAQANTKLDPPNSEPNAVPNLSDSSAEKPNRISFNVTPEGVPDWERMLPKTRAQLTELLKDKAVQETLGLNTEQVKKIEEIGFGEDEANALLDLLSSIDSIAASKIYKVPHEVTSEAFAFSADHRKKINPPLARVLNKWGPAILKTWKDEIGLGIVLFAVLNSQVRLMHILESKRRKNLTPPPAPRPVTSISEAPREIPKPEPAPVVESPQNA